MAALCIALLTSACSDTRFSAATAPDFKLPGLYGDRIISLSSHRGKVVYLTIWASWCIPCRQELPFLNRLRAQYLAQGLEILAVNTDADRQLALDFLEKYPVQLEVASDPDGTLLQAYNIEGLPTSFLIDRGGMIRHVYIGFQATDQDNILTQVTQLLAEHDPSKI